MATARERGERVFNVIVYDPDGVAVYQRAELGYSAMVHRHSDRQPDPPSPHAAWPDEASEYLARVKAAADRLAPPAGEGGESDRDL